MADLSRGTAWYAPVSIKNLECTLGPAKKWSYRTIKARVPSAQAFGVRGESHSNFRASTVDPM